jgi:catechol 2,3-dioxygenase-like lactoylglutathione lyase family enzyme
MLASSDLVAFVTVADPIAARAFYEDTLQLHLKDESSFALVFEANGTTLRVAITAGAVPQPYTVVGWTVADIRGAIEALAAAGTTLERFEGLDLDERGVWTTPGGDQVAWFKDPHGNLLSLTELSAASPNAAHAAR